MKIKTNKQESNETIIMMMMMMMSVKNTTEFVLCFPTTLGMRTDLECG